jgi:hypothetical protein
MKIRSITAFGLLLLIAATAIFCSEWGEVDFSEANHADEARELNDGFEPGAPLPSQIVSVGGIGEIGFSSATPRIPSIDWLRRLELESDEVLSRRIEGGNWNKPDVYFGKDGEILHIAVNKGNHDTIQFDSQSIKKLQDEQGLMIVSSGYPEGMLESGYNSDDFIKATFEFWDRGMGDPAVEIEITPVVVEIVPTGTAIDNFRRQWLHQRLPMILVKETDVSAPLHESAIHTESSYDRVPVESRVRRSWALKPYTPASGATVGSDGFPRGGVVFDEPLKAAWERLKRENLAE